MLPARYERSRQVKPCEIAPCERLPCQPLQVTEFMNSPHVEKAADSFAKVLVEKGSAIASVANATDDKKPTDCPAATEYTSELNDIVEHDSDSEHSEEGAHRSRAWMDDSGKRRKEARFCLHGGNLYNPFTDAEWDDLDDEAHCRALPCQPLRVTEFTKHSQLVDYALSEKTNISYDTFTDSFAKAVGKVRLNASVAKVTNGKATDCPAADFVCDFNSRTTNSGSAASEIAATEYTGKLNDIEHDSDSEQAEEGAHRSRAWMDDSGRPRKEASFCLAGGNLYNPFTDAEWDDLDDSDSDSFY